jgi:hypothetical protein
MLTNLLRQGVPVYTHQLGGLTYIAPTHAKSLDDEQLLEFT